MGHNFFTRMQVLVVFFIVVIPLVILQWIIEYAAVVVDVFIRFSFLKSPDTIFFACFNCHVQ